MDNKKVIKNSWATAFSVASVWFGTHVGGGFATGNQVIGYFAQFGSLTAFLYPLLAMGLLAITMHIVLKFARLNGFNNYKDTFSALYPNPKMEILYEIFYVIIILAGVAAAVAGAGEVVANFLGLTYVGATKLIINLCVVAVLVVLVIFGVKLVVMASTVLSIAIMILTAMIVVTGLIGSFDGTIQRLLSEYSLQPAAYTVNPINALIRGIFVYAAFQTISIAPMIAASEEMGTTGTKRACILGWLMNGLALALSAFMLSRWYPLLQAMKEAGIEGFKNATSIPNQSMLILSSMNWLLWLFSFFLFCAFVSTAVTLVFTTVNRFEPHFFPGAIKNEKVRSIIVALITIAVCFSISLLGLTTITTKLYGYDGYYAIFVVIIPAFIWGIPKIKKLQAEGKEEGLK